MRTISLILICCISGPAMAQIQVPPDCSDLAVREGYPTDVMNESQAKKAKIRLAYLRVRHPRDPMVMKCVVAVRLAKEAGNLGQSQ